MGNLEMEYSRKVSFLGNAFPEICKAGHGAVKMANLLTPLARAAFGAGVWRVISVAECHFFTLPVDSLGSNCSGPVNIIQ